MVASKLQAPHFYLSTEVEMDTVLTAAERANRGGTRKPHLTITAFLLRAVALTLAEHPGFNAVWNGEIVEQVDAINIGIAIALEDGLIAPALLDCRHQSVENLAGGLVDLIARTRLGKLRGTEISEGTFTLSNLGGYELATFTPIITPPQVAILGTAKTSERAVVRNGEVVVRRIMTATLSSDHRVVDGVGAAEWLSTFKRVLEEPESWALPRA